MLRAWFWQMLADTFAWGPNFSIPTCKCGKSNTSMRSKLPHIWHSFNDLHTDSNSVSYLCLELMIFKEETVCQGWGLPVSGTGLPKVCSQEDFLFNRISNILELKVNSIKKEQMRQKLIGKLDTVSAEILSWASRTKVLNPLPRCPLAPNFFVFIQ